MYEIHADLFNTDVLVIFQCNSIMSDRLNPKNSLENKKYSRAIIRVTAATRSKHNNGAGYSVMFPLTDASSVQRLHANHFLHHVREKKALTLVFIATSLAPIYKTQILGHDILSFRVIFYKSVPQTMM